MIFIRRSPLLICYDISSPFGSHLIWASTPLWDLLSSFGFNTSWWRWPTFRLWDDWKSSRFRNGSDLSFQFCKIRRVGWQFYNLSQHHHYHVRDSCSDRKKFMINNMMNMYCTWYTKKRNLFLLKSQPVQTSSN